MSVHGTADNALVYHERVKASLQAEPSFQGRMSQRNAALVLVQGLRHPLNVKTAYKQL